MLAGREVTIRLRLDAFGARSPRSVRRVRRLDHHPHQRLGPGRPHQDAAGLPSRRSRAVDAGRTAGAPASRGPRPRTLIRICGKRSGAPRDRAGARPPRAGDREQRHGRHQPVAGRVAVQVDHVPGLLAAEHESRRRASLPARSGRRPRRARARCLRRASARSSPTLLMTVATTVSPGSAPRACARGPGSAARDRRRARAPVLVDEFRAGRRRRRTRRRRRARRRRAISARTARLQHPQVGRAAADVDARAVVVGVDRDRRARRAGENRRRRSRYAAPNAASTTTVQPASRRPASTSIVEVAVGDPARDVRATPTPACVGRGSVGSFSRAADLVFDARRRA